MLGIELPGSCELTGVRCEQRARHEFSLARIPSGSRAAGSVVCSGVFTGDLAYGTDVSYSGNRANLH